MSKKLPEKEPEPVKEPKLVHKVPAPVVTHTPSPHVAQVTSPVLKRSPQNSVGIDRMQDGTYEYVKGRAGERLLFIDGARYEHVADDGDGCWLYRAQSF